MDRRSITSAKNGKLGGRPDGSKSWKTIQKEQMRAHYEEVLAKNFDELTHVHVEAAKDPANKEERKYALDQLMGKATETVKMQAEVSLKLDV